ncbi:MAG: hypothetical protein GY800_07300 [Planctomycetes bacterium]|nr:hypothetical protein [Planctomycetota bacterium]
MKDIMHLECYLIGMAVIVFGLIPLTEGCIAPFIVSLLVGGGSIGFGVLLRKSEGKSWI